MQDVSNQPVCPDTSYFTWCAAGRGTIKFAIHQDALEFVYLQSRYDDINIDDTQGGIDLVRQVGEKESSRYRIRTSKAGEASGVERKKK